MHIRPKNPKNKILIYEFAGTSEKWCVFDIVDDWDKNAVKNNSKLFIDHKKHNNVKKSD